MFPVVSQPFVSLHLFPVVCRRVHLSPFVLLCLLLSPSLDPGTAFWVDGFICLALSLHLPPLSSSVDARHFVWTDAFVSLWRTGLSLIVFVSHSSTFVSLLGGRIVSHCFPIRPLRKLGQASSFLHLSPFICLSFGGWTRSFAPGGRVHFPAWMSGTFICLVLGLPGLLLSSFICPCVVSVPGCLARPCDRMSVFHANMIVFQVKTCDCSDKTHARCG